MDNYVIFFCDDCDRLAPAIHAFKKVQPKITLHTSSTLDDLFNRIQHNIPQLLLLYFHDPAISYVETLRTIRENTASMSIPLLVYHDLPEGAELETAFKNFKKAR